MRSIQHHPHDDSLSGYAAGVLPAALSLVVGCHLQYCAQCRRRVADAEALGGGLIENIAPRALSAGRRDAVLAMLDDAIPAQAPAAKSVQVAAQGDSDIPRLLQPLLGVSNYRDLPWKTIVPGVRHLPLDCGEGTLRMLFIGAGKKMPVHSHRGNELTLILEGGYSDAYGDFNPGDIADHDCDVEHQPVADDDRDCICIAGLDDKLVFQGWIAKMMQPLVRL